MKAEAGRLRPVALALLLAGPAAAQSDRPSEADMFGEPAAPPNEAAETGAPASTPAGPGAAEAAADSTAPAPAGQAPDDREAQLFGGEASVVRRNPEVDADKLAIGGRMLLRAQLQAYTGTDAADQPLSSPNLLDVYLDARPTDRLRAFAEFRVSYDPTLEDGRAPLPDFCPAEPPVSDPGNAQCRAAADALGRAFATPATDSALNQLWIKTDVARRVFLTFGKQPIRWGAGHIWNPTDFINRSKRDPLTTLDLRTGVSLVKVHVPLEASASNLYAIALLDSARQVGDVGGAARAEIGFERAELTLSVAARRDRPLLAGGDFSIGVGIFDVFVEGAVSRGRHDPLPGEADRDDDFIPQVTGGLSAQIDYGDEDTFVVGVEYFHNGDGVDDPADYGAALAAGRSYFDLPRHAAGLYALVAAPGHWNDTSLFATAIGSLDDRSVTARLQLTHRVLTWLDVMPYVGGYFGQRGDLFRPAAFDPTTGAATSAALSAEAGAWLQMSL